RNSSRAAGTPPQPRRYTERCTRAPPRGASSEWEQSMRMHTYAAALAMALAVFSGAASAQTTTGGWAVVGAEGGVLKHQNVTKVHRIGTGTYRIEFNNDVSKCVYTGNIRGVVKTLTPGILDVARHDSDANAVFVRIFDAATLLPTDEKFNLLVTC